MSTEEQDREGGTAVTVGDEPGEGPKRKLEMQVDISDVGPCKKHVKVAIPRAEIERQFKASLEDFGKEVAVPGFRPGRAPRQLVIKRFKKQVAEQVKSSLLMASLEQLDEDYKLNPITQPQLDVAAIELPDDGPMDFEMEVEVRPDFAAAGLQGPDGQAAGPDDQRGRRRGPVSAVPRALRADRAQARRGRRARRLRHRRPGLPPPRRQRAQRGQGDPVPAPAGDAVPGRLGPQAGRRAGRAPSRARPGRPRRSSASTGEAALRGAAVPVQIRSTT